MIVATGTFVLPPQSQRFKNQGWEAKLIPMFK